MQQHEMAEAGVEVVFEDGGQGDMLEVGEVFVGEVVEVEVLLSPEDMRFAADDGADADVFELLLLLLLLC